MFVLHKAASLDKQLREVALQSTSPKKLYQSIVNIPFTDKLQAVRLDLGIVVLLLLNDKKRTIDRIALSETEMAQGAVNVSVKPFHAIKIPADYENNIISKAIHTNLQQHTNDWSCMFEPALSADEARLNQAGAGIGVSIVTPFHGRERKGALIFSFYQTPENIHRRHYRFAQKYADAVGKIL